MRTPSPPRAAAAAGAAGKNAPRTRTGHPPRHARATPPSGGTACETKQCKQEKTTSSSFLLWWVCPSLSWQMAVSQKSTARKRRRFRTPRSASAPLCRRAVHRLRGTRTVFLRGVFPSLSWQTIRPEPVLATHVLEPQASIVLDLVVPCKRILPSASSTAARLRSALNPLMCLSSGTEIRVEIEASAAAIRGAITCARNTPLVFVKETRLAFDVCPEPVLAKHMPMHRFLEERLSEEKKFCLPPAPKHKKESVGFAFHLAQLAQKAVKLALQRRRADLGVDCSAQPTLGSAQCRDA